MIDPKLQAELRAKFNPDGSELRNVQLRLLEMLKYLDKICKEHNIKYWLSSGTCLGAIRHGGFIPWDDDLDIELHKSDYKKLIKILKNQKHPQFVLQDYSTDKEYIFRFAKLRDLNSKFKEDYDVDQWFKYSGCFIDIFPIEPSRSKKLSQKAAWIWWKFEVHTCRIQNKSWRHIYHTLARPASVCAMNIISFVQKFGAKNILRHFTGNHFYKPRLAEDVSEVQYIRFEDADFPIPVGYKSYLSHMYGEYMELPDISNLHYHGKLKFMKPSISVNK